MNIGMCVFVCTYVCMYVCMYVRAHDIHIYIYTNIHTYTYRLATLRVSSVGSVPPPVLLAQARHLRTTGPEPLVPVAAMMPSCY